MHVTHADLDLLSSTVCDCVGPCVGAGMQLPSDGAAAALAPQAAHAGVLLGQGPQPLAAGAPGMLHGERCALPVMMSACVNLPMYSRRLW